MSILLASYERLPIIRYRFMGFVQLIMNNRYESDLVTKDQGRTIEVGLWNKFYNQGIFYRIWLGYPEEVILEKLRQFVISREILFRQFNKLGRF